MAGSPLMARASSRAFHAGHSLIDQRGGEGSPAWTPPRARALSALDASIATSQGIFQAVSCVWRFFQVRRVVVDEKHTHAFHARRPASRGRCARACFSSGRRTQKVEPAPSALSRSISPPIALDQLPGERQPQPGAPILARRRYVRLVERLEELALGVRRNPDPRVPHAKVERCVRFRLGGQFHTQRDLARGGELDRIADQIDQHLPQPARIAAQVRRDAGKGEAGEFETLAVRGFREQFDRSLDDFLQIEVKNLERELARLRLSRNRGCH